MRPVMYLLASAALAVGVSACSEDQNAQRASDTHRNTETEVTMRNDTSVPSDADVKRIREVLAETVDAALTKGGLDDVVERLAKTDRDRIGKYANNSYPDLDGRVADIQNSWRDRFQHDFKMKSDEAAFTDYRISGDAYHASAIVPAWGKMPSFTVRLVNEGTVKNTWRIDIPDDVNGQMLKDRMLNHLTMFGQHRDMWPADMHEAYRVGAYHVMAALSNANVTMP